MTNVKNEEQAMADARKWTFGQVTTVSVTIHARPEMIWALLTNAADFPRWNSTITSMEGTIAPGETIRLKVKLDAKRVFKLKVASMVPNERMTWQDGMAPFFKGVRTFTLSPGAGGSTVFAMSEQMGGLMYPMAAKHIPDFRPAFEQYAADLKKEAEQIMNLDN